MDAVAARLPIRPLLAAALLGLGWRIARAEDPPADEKKVVATAPDIDPALLTPNKPAQAATPPKAVESAPPVIQKTGGITLELTPEGESREKKRMGALGDIPDNVKNSILYGKSYNEGEIPEKEPLNSADVGGVPSPAIMYDQTDTHMPQVDPYWWQDCGANCSSQDL